MKLIIADDTAHILSLIANLLSYSTIFGHIIKDKMSPWGYPLGLHCPRSHLAAMSIHLNTVYGSWGWWQNYTVHHSAWGINGGVLMKSDILFPKPKTRGYLQCHAAPAFCCHYNSLLCIRLVSLDQWRQSLIITHCHTQSFKCNS